jgi:hypothetical protein
MINFIGITFGYPIRETQAQESRVLAQVLQSEQ